MMEIGDFPLLLEWIQIMGHGMGFTVNGSSTSTMFDRKMGNIAVMAEENDASTGKTRGSD